MTTVRRHLTLLLTGLLAACGAGTGSSGGNPGSTANGIAAPQEVSALPTKSNSAAAARSLPSALATDPVTDYSSAETFKFVDEQALSQFNTLNTIFKALAETHYADPENVNQGPYGCMVEWDDKGGSTTGKQLVPWVVDSEMTADAQSRQVNRVKVWMQMNMGDGQMHLIKVELDIYEAPTQLADGSYSDYGVWNLNAKFDEAAIGYFAASSDHDANGLSVVMLHQVDASGGAGGPGPETKGILRRSGTAGYGLVSFPDYSSCQGPSCSPVISTVSYAYNANHVALEQADNVVYKDRNSVVDLVNRYGLFDATTGDDVTKTHSFGFPVNYVDPQGHQHWGYYGSWQGRHQLGYDGMNEIPPGSTVTRSDLPPSAPAQSFIASDLFTGTLVKRTLVPGDIQGIKGIVVQTWVNKNFPLGWDGTHWLTCPPGEWINVNGDYANPGVPVCSNGPGPDATPTMFTDFASLVLNPNDPQQQVTINLNQQCAYPCSQPPPPVMLVYDGTQFYHTDWTPSPGPMTQPVSNGNPYVPQTGDQLWVNLGGPIYVSYDGTGFVQKKVLSFSQNNMTAVFDPNGDQPYALDPNLEYYFNTPGVDYVVKATGTSTYDVKVELQSVANPLNASTFVPAGTTFRQQWDNGACSVTCPSPLAQSTYSFDVSSMKLVYACVSDSDKQNNVKAGDALTTPQWGLVAYDASCNNTGVQYNWDYPQGQQPGNFGTQQYLKRGDGSYVILEDPIRLAPIQLANHHGDVLTLSLQFDGNWVNGLPDVYSDLQSNDFVLTQAIADKVVVIPAGTEVVDANDATKHYLFKPLQMNEYLSVIADPGDVDLTPAAGLDLSIVPGFVDAHLPALPNVPLKYSEGKLIQ
jgi:hypothetical protein